MNKTVKLLISVAIPVVIGLIGGGFTASEIPGWFAHLNKPSWNPPNWVFAPVWTSLYVLMGIAFYIVWKSTAVESVKKTAIILFFLQLLLNFFWSIIFFNQHQLGLAMIDIVLLWLFIMMTIFSFGKISSAAAWLLVPYISWVSFASVLNYTIWRIN